MSSSAPSISSAVPITARLAWRSVLAPTGGGDLGDEVDLGALGAHLENVHGAGVGALEGGLNAEGRGGDGLHGTGS
jgi:hypothetical protein